MTERELLAGLRVLALTARADGKLSPAETEALTAALHDFRQLGDYPGLPLTAEELLSGTYSLDIEEELVKNAVLREKVYAAALAMANADGLATPEELALLERLRPPEAEGTLLGQVLGEARDTVLPASVEHVHDPGRRQTEVREDILKYSLLAAVIGAMPIPGLAIFADAAVVALQVKMTHDIGRYHGHTLDRGAIQSLLGTISGGIVLRVALNQIARLVPGVGSLFAATTSFASTMAIGEVVYAYFDAGGQLSPEEMRTRYAAALKAKKAEFAHHQAAVAATEARAGSAATRLAEELRAGRITKAEYEARVAALK